MGTARDRLEVALRRSLGFHLGRDGADEEEERELLISGFVEAAKVGALRNAMDVGRELDDYYPDSGLSALVREELCDDVLRDTLKHFPVDRSADEEEIEEGKGDGGEEEEGEEEEEGGPGCCVLCERFMPLTRHHLIPRTTHKRFRKKGYKDEILNRTIAICRPCHSAVHRSHDVRTLAERFDTREKLLEDEAISRFVGWAQKQRLTKKEDANNRLLRYRR